MEHTKATSADENRHIKDYQSPTARRMRFYQRSDVDGFYLESSSGLPYKMPNYFCAVKDGEINSWYFFLRRVEYESFKYVTASIEGDGFSFNMGGGLIWNNWSFLESKIYGREFVDPDTTLNQLNEQFKNLFNNFYITI